MIEEKNPFSLDHQIGFAVYATSHAFTRCYKPLLEEIGLTFPQYLAMLALWEEDGITVKALAERMELESPTVTPIVKRLEKLKLITRRRNPKDERQLILELTPRGHAMRIKSAHIPAEVNGQLHISQEAVNTLISLLSKLKVTLQTQH